MLSPYFHYFTDPQSRTLYFQNDFNLCLKTLAFVRSGQKCFYAWPIRSWASSASRWRYFLQWISPHFLLFLSLWNTQMQERVPYLAYFGFTAKPVVQHRTSQFSPSEWSGMESDKNIEKYIYLISVWCENSFKKGICIIILFRALLKGQTCNI